MDRSSGKAAAESFLLHRGSCGIHDILWTDKCEFAPLFSDRRGISLDISYMLC